jgi:hypothetical protein
MAAYQGLHIGQPHAFSRHVLLTDAAKRLKDFGHILCRNAAAVILHMERRVRQTALRRDDHLARATGLQIIDGIAQEIAESLFQGGAIAIHRRQGANAHAHLALGYLVLQCLQHLLDQSLHVDALEVQLTAAQPG